MRALRVRWMLGYVLLAQNCVQSSIPYEITEKKWRRVKLAARDELELAWSVWCMQQALAQTLDAPLFPVVFLVGSQVADRPGRCTVLTYLQLHALLPLAHP